MVEGALCCFWGRVGVSINSWLSLLLSTNAVTSSGLAGSGMVVHHSPHGLSDTVVQWCRVTTECWEKAWFSTRPRLMSAHQAATEASIPLGGCGRPAFPRGLHWFHREGPWPLRGAGVPYPFSAFTGTSLVEELGRLQFEFPHLAFDSRAMDGVNHFFFFFNVSLE